MGSSLDCSRLRRHKVALTRTHAVTAIHGESSIHRRCTELVLVGAMGVEDAHLNCTNLTKSDFRHLTLVRGSISAVCAAIWVVVVCTAVCCSYYRRDTSEENEADLKRQRRKRRILVYLFLVAMANFAAFTAQFERLTRYGLEDAGCHATAYFVQAVTSCQLCSTAWIAVFILFSTQTTLSKLEPGRTSIFEVIESEKLKSVLEIVLVLLAIVLSFGFAAIPFATHSYGETGPWCWITIFDNNCGVDKDGLYLQLGLWYAPTLIVMVVIVYTLVLMICTIIPTFRRVTANDHRVKLYRLLGKTFFSLIVFFVISAEGLSQMCILFKYEVIGLWYLYAVGSPLFSLAVPITFLVYVVKELSCHVPCRTREQYEELN